MGKGGGKNDGAVETLPEPLAVEEDVPVVESPVEAAVPASVMDGPPVMDAADLTLEQPSEEPIPTGVSPAPSPTTESDEEKKARDEKEKKQFKGGDLIKVALPGFDIDGLYGEIFGDGATKRSIEASDGSRKETYCWDVALYGRDDGLYQIPGIFLKSVKRYTAITR